MQTTTMLVVSDPPHGDVKEEVVSAVLGLPADHTRLKIRFGAPELLAATDPDSAVELALSLKAAGVSAEMRDADGLVRLPWPTLASSFEFGEGGLSARFGSQAVELAYDEPLVGVYCQPPSDFRPPEGVSASALEGMSCTGPAAAEALEWIPHLDLYYSRSGAPARLSIAGGTMVAMVDECRSRFTNLLLDTRLEGVRPRQRFVPGERGFDPDLRKRYAFGTLLLRHVLESISAELRDVTQYELGSRLAYVLHRGAPG
ncbi:MAG TPA: hypothetical protein VMM35_05185 [Longimicrobiales bacterium]|nr:hypothetical protein [Longimicrobiales bacterium]